MSVPSVARRATACVFVCAVALAQAVPARASDVSEGPGSVPLVLQPLDGFTAAQFAPIPGFQAPLWELDLDAERAVQRANAQPALLVADFAHGTRRFEVEVAVETLADGDAVGFAFGFEPQEQFAAGARWWLVDWRRSAQVIDFPGGPGAVLGAPGLALSQVRGVPSPEAFWGHVVETPSRGVFELARASALGASGWQPGATHVLACELSPSRVRVWVDGALELDVAGDFAAALPTGRVAFYDFSQVGAAFALRAERVPASATPYGVGTPGLLGVPALEALALPVLGGTLRLRAGNSAAAPSDACVLFGLAPLALDLGIGVLLVEPPFVAITVLHPFAPQGAELAYPVPALAACAGLTLYAQLVQTDPAGTGGHAWSRGLALVLGE